MTSSGQISDLQGQVFQKLWQYKCNLTTFWHGLLPNMAMSRDSG